MCETYISLVNQFVQNENLKQSQDMDQIRLQGENPCQVLLVLPGLMSVRIALRGKAALVSIKESYFYTLYAVYGQLL